MIPWVNFKPKAYASIFYPFSVYLGYQLIESRQDGFILPVWYREDPNITLSDLTVEFTVLSTKDAYFSSIPFSSASQTGNNYQASSIVKFYDLSYYESRMPRPRTFSIFCWNNFSWKFYFSVTIFNFEDNFRKPLAFFPFFYLKEVKIANRQVQRQKKRRPANFWLPVVRN